MSTRCILGPWDVCVVDGRAYTLVTVPAPFRLPRPLKILGADEIFALAAATGVVHLLSWEHYAVHSSPDSSRVLALRTHLSVDTGRLEVVCPASSIIHWGDPEPASPPGETPPVRPHQSFVSPTELHLPVSVRLR
jgi:hypothetical protein